MHILDRLQAQSEHQRSIWCPHCGGEYDDTDDYYCVSMYGTNENVGPYELECGWCCKTFWVTEWVGRTYCVSKKNEMAYSNEDKARWKP